MRPKTINKKKEQIEVKRKEEDSWYIVARKLMSRHVIERLEKVESGMIEKKCEMSM